MPDGLIITAAFAVLEGQYHKMYRSTDSAATALFRLGTKPAGGDWAASPPTGASAQEAADIDGWFQSALSTLVPQVEPHDVAEPTGAGDPHPVDFVTKSAPWYAVFMVDHPHEADVQEIWAGRFMPGTEVEGDAPDAGVFFFYQGQGVDVIASQDGAVLTGVPAVKSMIFPSFDATGAASSEAKEQGCSVDGDEVRKQWPVND